MRQDQQFRDNYLTETVRGSDAKVLHKERLVGKREIHMRWEVPEMDHERPFYYDILEFKPFMFTRVKDWIRIVYSCTY